MSEIRNISATMSNADLIESTVAAMHRAARDNRLVAKNWRLLSMGDLASVIELHCNRPAVLEDKREIKRVRTGLIDHSKFLREAGVLLDSEGLTNMKDDSGVYRLVIKTVEVKEAESEWDRALKLLDKGSEKGDGRCAALLALLNDLTVEG